MSADVNKHVEGLWIVTSVHKWPDEAWTLPDEDEYKGKSRVAVTKQGLKTAVRAAWDYDTTIRVEVEEYDVGGLFTYNAEKPEKK